jgi:thioesterase domain-containing protein
MAAALTEGRPVYAIEMQWLCETRQGFIIEQLAAFYLNAIRKIQKSGPYFSADILSAAWWHMRLRCD